MVAIGLLLVSFWPTLFPEATCFDGVQNGAERGVDCGGECARICAIDVQPPRVAWARSFAVSDGQYNAVAYIENRNAEAATEELRYTITLYDERGAITERSGVTTLPPDSTYPIFEGRLITRDREPIRTVVELKPTTEWYASETGRRSLTVPTFDLLDVDTAPRLEATLVNRELTEAEDVAVVATIFDRNGAALTASETYVERLAGDSRRDIVFTWPNPIAKTIRSCSVPIDVMLAVDLSGSMNNDQDDPPEPITSVLTAAEQFLARLRSGDQAGVVTFATDASVAHPLSADLAAARAVVSDLAIDPAEEQGSTNTGAAFAVAQEEFTSLRDNPDAREVMVILTDGLATAPDETPEEFARAQAAAVKEMGVEVYSIGLGEEVNMDFVRDIASRDETAFAALSADQIDGIYQRITGALCEDGPARVDIIPKSTDIIR